MFRDAVRFFLCVKMAKIDLFPFTVIVTWNNVVVTVILLTYNNTFKYVVGNASIHSTE